MPTADRAHRDFIEHAASKVPALTLGFWIVKIAATTLGETAGDWVSMSLNLGYLVGSLIFLVAFVILVAAQIRARAFHPSLYWATIVATTTLGTTLADAFDRSLGVGYPGGVSIILALLALSLAVWYRVEGSVSIESVVNARVEWFYWSTILFSQTLGTALGDWVAGDDRGGLGLGYGAGTAIFGGCLVVIALLWFVPRVSRTAIFWAAFVLTRPLGATLGDLLDKPFSQGGLDISRLGASGVLVLVMLGCIHWMPQRAARRATSK
ncbi:hypothetical protein [Pararobbsia silviterrae]|uniref:Membrane-anchored protein n=1 Tax=Pararobbsia silviterrae TaxID=1792498 RepID=A0A494XYX1_9BURK|nr:hypothetical protein [Pararobbsia silviterrae]RKP55775.1 hypothetical protein D7S86_11180 [Pararobbsia silviterrae]